jgi:hypothetical protein
MLLENSYQKAGESYHTAFATKGGIQVNIDSIKEIAAVRAGKAQ